MQDESGMWKAEFSTQRKDFLPKLVDSIALFKRQTGKKVKRIRLDNAPEYRSAPMIKWANRVGIILEYTTTYTHE